MADIKVKNCGAFPVAIEVGNWIDLCTAEDVTMLKGEYKEISLGVAMKLPAGYEAIVAPRSSTFKKWGIIMTNSIGVIDETYCGNNDVWRFPAYALKRTVIPKGTRIAQFRVLKHQPSINVIEVEKLDGKDRGGIGATGN